MRGPRGGFRAILPRMSPPVLRFVLGRQPQTLANVPPDRTLLNVLRDDLHCTAVKEGCASGDCANRVRRASQAPT